GGMTAGKDQPQPVIGERRPVRIGRIVRAAVRGLLALRRETRHLLAQQRLTPDVVDPLVPADMDEPGACILRNAGGGPLLDGGREGFLARLLGKIEVPEEPDEGREHAAPFVSEYLLDDPGVHARQDTLARARERVSAGRVSGTWARSGGLRCCRALRLECEQRSRLPDQGPSPR